MSKLQEKAEKFAQSLWGDCFDATPEHIEKAVVFGYELCQKEYEEKLRWIPVEEKLPPLNEYVLFKYSGDEYCVGCLNVYGYYCSTYNPIENDHASIHLLSEVTHWRCFLK